MISKLKSLFQISEPPRGEAWVYWVSHAETLRWMNVLLTLLLMTTAILGFVSLRKPPIVVRVDEVGKAQIIRDISINNEPSDVEIIAYTKDFLRSYIEINSLTVQKDFTKALNMMTSTFQAGHIRELRSEHFLEKVGSASIQTQLEIKQISITSKTPSRVYLDIRGITATTPLEDKSAPPSKKGLAAKLCLALVPRTERSPNGLLVDDYRQQIVPLEEMLGPEKVLTNNTEEK